MSKPWIDSQAISTIFQGALGALTFGAYNQFITNKMMELNKEIMDNKHKSEFALSESKHREDLILFEIKHKNDLMNMEMKHKEDIKMLLEKIEKLEDKNKTRWW